MSANCVVLTYSEKYMQHCKEHELEYEQEREYVYGPEYERE
jgi:hypothetical protein